MNVKSVRAQPLSLDERQSMIIDATIPLLLERGREITSREIADAAGVAEGTIFRAFGDKESLVRAAAERFLDPEPLRAGLRAIDSSLSLEVKIRAAIELVQNRLRGVFRMVALLPEEDRPQPRPGDGDFATIIAALLEPDRAQLGWPGERVAHVIRLIAVASSFPRLSDGTEFSLDELTSIVMHGVARDPKRNGK